MHDSAQPIRPTPLGAVIGLTLLASIGTGIFWNGMPFIAETDYGFSESDNLWLFLALGAVYVVAALMAGRVIRVASRIASPRTLIACIVVGQGAVCLGPWIIDRAWIVWAVTLVISASSAILWPTVESYLAAGRSGKRLRFAIGLWNVAWTLAVAISLIGMAPLMGEGARLARFAIVALGGVNIIAAFTLIKFNRKPLEPGDLTAGAEVGANYRHLLHGARILLPTSYLLIGMLSPLMPYRMEALDVAGAMKTPLTATWMLARVAALLIMWRLPFWHGRWGTLLLGGVATTGGFLLMLIAPTVSAMFAALTLFGAGQGMLYYAAIYYAMSVGHAEVDAAGTHEGLIGLGYAAGPAVGLASIALAGALSAGDDAAAAKLVPVIRIIAIVVVVIVAALMTARPYFASKRAPRNAATEESPRS